MEDPVDPPPERCSRVNMPVSGYTWRSIWTGQLRALVIAMTTNLKMKRPWGVGAFEHKMREAAHAKSFQIQVPQLPRHVDAVDVSSTYVSTGRKRVLWLCCRK
jgi:hypothetical protein